MAEKIVSPGVFTRENDLSFLQQGVAAIGAAFIGPFKEGPIVPTIVESQADFQTLFGTVDDTYYTPLAVQSYLKESGTATICRVLGLNGYSASAPILLSVTSGSGASAYTASIAVLFPTSNNTLSTGLSGSNIFATSSVGAGDFNITITGSNSNTFSGSTSIDPDDPNNIINVFGNDPLGPKGAYVYAFFKNIKYSATNTTGKIPFDAFSSASFTLLGTQQFAMDAKEARTPYIQSQLIAGQRYNLFRFETIGAGNAANTKVKIGISNIKRAGSVSGTDYGTFTITVRAFDDTNKTKSVLETYTNLNLDPTSANYIYRVIGDRYKSISSTGKITEYGDWVNNSKYVRLVSAYRDASLDTSLIPTPAVPYGHAPYQLPFTIPSPLAATIPSASIVAADSTTFGGIDLDFNADNDIYLAPIPSTNTAATTGSNVAITLDTTFNYPLTGSAAADIAVRNLIVAFQEGFDGMAPTIVKAKGADIVPGNTQGFDLTTSTSMGSLAYAKHINALSNSDEWDINMVVAPGVIKRLHNSTATSIIDMVEYRSDAFYIMDTTAYADTIEQATIQAAAVDTNYAATYYPWIKTIDVNTNKLISVPPSVLLPGVFASNDRVAAEWFAPAGLNRGGLTGAVSVLNRLTHAERDTLYEGKVNPIAQFPGTGIVVFGQKTLQSKASALDRINVRRLLLTVRKYIASTSKYLIFEQNTATTRNKFINIANPYLEAIQQRQGLYAFKVVMDETNNTPDVIDRNFLKGSIYLQPTKTAEFIQIDFNILPTGASFGG